MPCTRRRYGADGTIVRWVRCPATWLFPAYARLAYHHLAGRAAAQIADYLRSVHIVESVVGIGGSPSCGVHTTLDAGGPGPTSLAATPRRHQVKLHPLDRILPTDRISIRVGQLILAG